MTNDVQRGPRDVITIDGPAASGKSTVSRIVAQRLEIPFVSSGMLYRAAAFLVLEHGVNPAREAEVLALLDRYDVALEPRLEGNVVRIDGADVTAMLHTDRVDATVSDVAAHPDVRSWVFSELRGLSGPFVVEGRDMGTAVFPRARHKFYLTASPEVRAGRRVGERSADLEDVTAAIRLRDALDAKQLAPAPDAVRIDTDALTLEQVVDTVLAEIDAVPPVGASS